jgi:hypothetical protein
MWETPLLRNFFALMIFASSRQI